jgi:hypothetical protein
MASLLVLNPLLLDVRPGPGDPIGLLALLFVVLVVVELVAVSIVGIVFFLKRRSAAQSPDRNRSAW